MCLLTPPEARTYTVQMPGRKAAVNVGPRGRLIAVADGPSAMGFWVCDWCGHGAARHEPSEAAEAQPPAEESALQRSPAAARSRARLRDRPVDHRRDVFGYRATQAAWKSVLYAVVEAACEALEIARDDIGGSLTPVGADHWSVTLFDAVSGGAGHVLQVEQNLGLVLAPLFAG